MALSESYRRIYQAVKQIPPGRVATYGQIAAIAGYHRQARMVGYALHSIPEGWDIPWHRVINSQGKISLSNSGWGKLQRILLEQEGIEFSSKGNISLVKYRWEI
jgi:methylated-DNA-protein-cysteine methyltransferase-like protein